MHRILFRQNLREKAKKWYFDLKKATKNDWMTLQTIFKTQFIVKTNSKANKYLLLQKVTTLNQKQNKDIIKYFEQAKSLARHLFNVTKTIDYNVVKMMKNKSQKKNESISSLTKIKIFHSKKSNRSFKSRIRRYL